MTNYFTKSDSLIDAVKQVLGEKKKEPEKYKKEVEKLKAKGYWRKQFTSLGTKQEIWVHKDNPEDTIKVNPRSGKVMNEELDPVNKKAVKKDFDDRKDKDIDNDGDVDASDKYLHNRRKKIKKALKEKTVCEMCGKVHEGSCGMKEEVVDEAFNLDIGTKVAIKSNGKMIYGKVIGKEKVMGKPGVEVKWSSGGKGRFSNDQFAALSMDKKADYVISESVDLEDDDGETKTAAQKNDMDGDGKNDKAKKVKKKKEKAEDELDDKPDAINTKPELDQSKTMVSEREMTDKEKAKLDRLKKKHEGGSMHKAMKKEYGDRGDEVFFAKLTKMAMGEEVDLNVKTKRKLYDEELEEGRGRPKKEDEVSKDSNFVMQMRKAVSMRGQSDVNFNSGTSKVSLKDASGFLTAYGKAKTADQKDALMNMAKKSPKHLALAIKGKIDKPKNPLDLD